MPGALGDPDGPPYLLPAPPGVPPRQRPAEALEALASQLPEPGRFYVVADQVLGVLSLPAVSVRSNGLVLGWRTKDGGTAWPAADAPGAVRRLTELMSPEK